MSLSKEFLIGIGFILISIYILIRIIRIKEHAIFLWSGNVIRKDDDPKNYYRFFIAFMQGALTALMIGVIFLMISLEQT